MYITYENGIHDFGSTIQRILQGQGFIVDHHGRLDPTYPRTAYIDDYIDAIGGINIFIAHKPDMAMNAVVNNGGIDLTAARMNLQIKNDSSQGIKFHLDAAQLALLQNAPGFVPVIISVEPVKDLKLFLGIVNQTQ